MNLATLFTPARLNWLGLLARLTLGGVIFVAGALKVTTPYKAAAAMRAYELLPISVANIFGYALPWFEVGLGALLILGVATRLSAISAGFLMIVFILAISSAWARGLSIDCGCFGGGGQVAPGETKYLQEILRDVGLTLLAVYLYWRPQTKWALEPGSR
jgi:uncharacterized membrane protein YphA (DoxX/SURF4 family)